MSLQTILDDIRAVADKRIVEEHKAHELENERMVLNEGAHAARRLADDLEKVAPAESMYLCSIASRLEIKAARLSKK